MASKQITNRISDNKGLSLVELIVAISLGVIVAGSIAALMTFTIRTYRNESVNTEMQYELQTNLNMMMDEIMASSTVAIRQNGGSTEPHTKYALFGNPNVYIPLEGGTEWHGFKGVIFVPSCVKGGKFNIYMKSVEVTVAAGTEANVKTIAENEYNTIFKSYVESADPNIDLTPLNKYLLGENATQFDITPNPACIIKDETDPSSSKWKYNYKNPLEFNVKLKFEKSGWGAKNYSKKVDDIAYMRNKVTGTVYVDGLAYKPLKKEE